MGDCIEPKRYLLEQANYWQLLDYKPNVAILPWGATEAHNYHLPHGTDTIQAGQIAARASEIAVECDAKPIVLPPIPFGNNAQQQDQVVTIHLSTRSALSILADVAASLKRQGIDRLLLLNGHGGNEFKPMVRDVQLETGLLIVVLNFWEADQSAAVVFDEAGDHANEMETSLLLHLSPEWVALDQAGPGNRVPFQIDALNETGAWTPRPWSHSHPDTGSGDPRAATAEKGQEYFEAVSAAIAKVIVGLSHAKPGDMPYFGSSPN